MFAIEFFFCIICKTNWSDERMSYEYQNKFEESFTSHFNYRTRSPGCG